MNTPTKITVSRIVAIVLMIIALVSIDFICFFNKDFETAIASFKLGNTNINIVHLCICVIFILASITDFLDGYLARKNNQVTDLGKFLDPVADKLLVNSIIIYLAVPHGYLNSTAHLTWPWISVVIIIARDIVVDALRFIAANKKQVIAANFLGKAKTVLQMIAIPAILLNGWPFNYFDSSWPNEFLRVSMFFVYAATFVSCHSGIIYLKQNAHVFKESKVPQIIKICKEKEVTFGSVESITGGSFASAITRVSGASSAFKGNVTTYATEIKESVVGVSKETIDVNTVVSAEVAKEMAEKGRKLLNVDYCVSCTGNAGPTVCEGNKAVGLVYIAIASKDETIVKELNLKGKRNDIQNKTVDEMINIVYNIIK